MRDNIKVVSELYQVFLMSLLLLVITHNLIKRKITLPTKIFANKTANDMNKEFNLGEIFCSYFVISL